MQPLILKVAGLAARILPAPLRRSLYRLGPLSRWVRQRLTEAAPQGRTEIEVAAGLLQGYRMRLDLRLEKDCWLGTYEPELQEAIQVWVKPGMTAYDVGANIGYISLMLAAAVGPGGRVYAFEALPENFERLRQNLALNDVGRRIHPTQAAVVDGTKNAAFQVHASSSMGKAAGSSGRGEVYESSISVAGISLDDFVYVQGHPSPHVVKLDIEGGEVLALPGMARLLVEGRPLVFLELHGQESARAAWAEFRSAGYQLQRMVRGYPRIQEPQDLDWKAYVVATPAGPASGTA